MKTLTIMVLVFALLSVALVSPGFAQNTTEKAARQKEEVAKRTEKVHKKVNKLGVGDNATIKVTLFDDKTFSGHISETNDKSFTVVDKSGTSQSINYSDVKALEGRNTFSGTKAALYIGIGAGAVLLAFYLIFIHNAVCPPSGC